MPTNKDQIPTSQPVDDFDHVEWGNSGQEFNDNQELDEHGNPVEDFDDAVNDLQDEVTPAPSEATKLRLVPSKRPVGESLGSLPIQEILVETNGEARDIQIPIDYEIWRDGIAKRDMKSFVPGDPWPEADPEKLCPASHRQKLTFITRYPIIVTHEGRTTTTFTAREKGSGDLLVGLEIRSAGGFRRRSWVPVKTLVSAQLIVSLAEDGADVTSVNARDCVAYISACRAMNGDVEPVRVIRRCGYYEIDRQPCWLVGRHWIGHVSNIALDLGKQSKLQRGYGPGENSENLDATAAYNAWRDFMWTYFTHERGAISRFLLGFSCVAPVSELIGQFGFLLHLFAQAGRGKSALAALVTTMWGSSEKGYLFQVLDKTRLGITAKFEHHASHLFMVYDEAQVVGKSFDWDTLIYSLSSGQGRGRVSNTGADMLSDESTFRAIVMTTGEGTIVGAARRDSGGQAKRVIEIDLNKHLAYPLKDLAGIYDFLPRNLYGWGGVVFLQAIHARFCRSPQGLAEFKSEYLKLKAQIVTALSDVSDGDLVQRLASIAFGEMLMLGLLFGDRLGELEGLDTSTLTAADIWQLARRTAIRDALHVYERGVQAGRADDSRPMHERFLTALRTDMATNREAYVSIDINRDAADQVKQRGHAAFSGFIIDGPTGAELVLLDGAFDRLCRVTLDTTPRRVLSDLVEHEIALKAGASNRVERSRVGLLPRDRYVVIPYTLVSPDDAANRGVAADFGGSGWSLIDGPSTAVDTPIDPPTN